MDINYQLQDQFNRRTFLKRTGGVGMAALLGLVSGEAWAAPQKGQRIGGLSGLPHFAPKANRVIYLFQSGAPSQMELYDPKPQLAEMRGQELPDSVRKGQRLTAMTSGQKMFPVANSIYGSQKYGECGMEMSELLPNIGGIADEICLVRSMYTDAINHDPAVTFLQSGFQKILLGEGQIKIIIDDPAYQPIGVIVGRFYGTAQQHQEYQAKI